jgi:hypothetical protein
MTWIVGMPTTCGYSFGISDVRVTLANGNEVDCLQKIHPVGQFVAAGFAGSVEIGFAMLETLHQLLYLEDITRAWDPVTISTWWPQDARNVFALFPKKEQVSQSHLLMIAPHPTENIGGEWPRTYGYIFKSPDFLPEEIPMQKIGAIGSGNGIIECKSAIDRISSDFDTMFSVLKGEQGTHGGMGTRLGFELTNILKRIRPSGVSAHLHYCWTYRGEVIIKTNNHWTKGAWTKFENGSGYGQPSSQKPPVDLTADGGDAFQMPVIAASWDQFVNLLNASGASAVGCVA